ncbi:hypothetical protein RSA37_04905 [Mammaliicoccus sciuri]|uniref:hypothetical protein n=1 Tax=Mammaliicoccus TaxID=2803850 RepID=UPI0007341B98|nr:hypothetical protein [Mammaliicoccus sciuri]KTT85496.1 hypothetical protein NS1R_06210 [Mammaliicoccus sciuri]KTT87746.1 hypothetical protein NS112_10995 [Mammaliicoccus sciuri]KTT91767.1 hypothetical protein NS36R_02390 [Mammaliicoccus sciuri]KTT93393.1 hypothetical protein NS44R_10655 [Mammaliicoccus sciuri]KTW12719.1 hypothetical protein RSA37_04905 [Mammaliicoccus sciuri]
MSEIIPFPKLKKQLVNNIYLAIRNEQFDEAYELFETYEQHFEMDDDLSIKKCEVLKSCGYYLELREEASILLNQGHPLYDKIVIYFVESLYFLEQYRTVVEIINQIKDENIEHATRMALLPIQDMAKEKLNQRQLKASEVLRAFQETQFEEQINLLIDLIDHHLGIFNLTLAQIIENELLHPNVQSLILEYLRLSEWSAEVKFDKIDETITVIPTELPGIERTNFTQNIIPKVIDQLEIDSPSSIELAKSLLNQHAIIMYPITLNDINDDVLVACYLKLLSERFNIDANYESVTQQDWDMFIKVIQKLQ